MSTDLKLSEAQISKIIQSGGFLGSLLSKLAGPLMKVAIPLAKNVLAPLGITAASSTIDAGIKKKSMVLVIFCPPLREIRIWFWFWITILDIKTILITLL